MSGFGRVDSLEQIVLLSCGLINIAIALLHIYIIFVGAPAYRYFGAGEWMAQKDEQGSLIPDAVTWGVTSVFFVFAFYNLAAAKLFVFSPPLLFWGILAISVIYILRGSAVVAIPFMSGRLTTFEKVSTYIALAIGLLNILGVYLYYKNR